MIAQQFTPRALNDAPTEDRRPPRDERLTLALERYAAAIDAGHPLSKDELLTQFADVADELRGCLDSLDFIRQVAPQLADPHVGESLRDSHRDSQSAAVRGSPDPAHPASSIQHPASGPATLGDFRILREIGRGGMGVVYEAEQLSLGRSVALKVLPFAAMLDRQQLARFKNEARAAATLDHPNIVAIHSVGCERGVHYYAMQLIEGQSLAEVIAAQRQQHLPLPPGRRSAVAGEGRGEGSPGEGQGEGALQSEIRNPKSEIETQPVAHLSTLHTPHSALPTASSSLPAYSSRDYFRTIARLGIQAAEALDHAHSSGILHRDIKPANLLVDDTGKLWIADFGLARIEQDAGMTMTGDILGTLRYMSPEQALAKRVVVDHRCDIYSLGVTLYELLTLQPTFTGDDRQELLRQIAFDEPRNPRQINSRIPQDLETIVLKAIEKNPADRYSSTHELADDFRRFLGDQPIKAKRPKLFTSVRKWSRRHRPVVCAAAATFLVSGLAVAGAIGWTVRDAQARLAATKKSVDFVLKEADRLIQDDKWSDALSAVERADALVAGIGGDSSLGARVQHTRKDIEMVQRLEEIRLSRVDVGQEGEYFDENGTDLRYAQAFREYGADPLALEPNDAGARIRSSAIRLELTLALEDWAFIRRQLISDDQASKRLIAVARAADPDESRNRLRDALESPHRERKTLLLQLADSFDADRLPAPTAVLLGRALRTEAGDAERSVALLAAQRRYPGDLYINGVLADSLSSLNPPDLDAAVRFRTANLAIRPLSPAMYYQLARTHAGKKNLDEAIECLKQAIRIKPDWWQSHYSLGEMYRVKGAPNEATASFMEAIRLKPDSENAYSALDEIAREAGAVDELIAFYKEGIRLKPNWWLARKYLAQALLGKAQALRKNDALDEAIVHFKEVIALKPDSFTAHQGLGEAFAHKGRRQEANMCVTEARRLLADSIVTGPITNPTNGHNYYLLAKNNWTDSEAAAVLLGGHLVTINDDAENSRVTTTFANFGGVSRALWIGLNDVAVEGTFEWVSGEPLGYANWGKGEPNDHGRVEDCVHIFPPTGSGGRYPKWNDAPNQSDAFDYVCNGVVEVANESE